MLRVISQFSKYLPSGYEIKGVDSNKAKVFYNNQQYSGTVTLSTLRSLDITVSDNPLTVNHGSEGSLTLSADVSGNYYDNSTAGITSRKITGATVTWGKSGDLPVGITLENGVLKAASTLTAGTHTANLKVTASYGDRETSKNVSVTVTVNKVLKGVSVDITPATATLSVKQGGTQTAQFKASATATYSDGSTKDITAITYSLDKDYGWIKIDPATGIVTASPTASTEAKDYSVTLKATATPDNDTSKAQTAETTLTVTVTAKSTEKTLTSLNVKFSSVTIKLTVEQGGTQNAQFRATATATYSDGSTKDITPTYSLESAYNWIILNASTGTVTASPTSNVSVGNYPVKVIATAAEAGVTGKQLSSLCLIISQENKNPVSVIRKSFSLLTPHSSLLTNC